MNQAGTVVALLAQLDARKAHGKYNRYPSIEELRQIWAIGQHRGRIDILEGPQAGDAEGTSIAIIVSGAAGQLIRVTLSQAECLNLARALLEAC